jgi:hypothetical protein
VKVECSGLYEFVLRRWPQEASHALGDGIDGEDVAFERDAIAQADWWWYRGGQALAIDAAVLEVGAQGLTVQVDAGQDAARLQAWLDAGVLKVRAWFTGEHLRQSPYYVDVRRVDR